MAVLTVNTASDLIDSDDGLVTLREAIIAANTDTITELGDMGSGADEIRFLPSVTAGGPITIQLLHGEMAITEDLSISGTGANLITIDAQHQSRIFNIPTTEGDFAFSGLTLTNGSVLGNPSNLESANYGGAIRSLTTGLLTIETSIIRDSLCAFLDYPDAMVKGGGIYGSGALVLRESTVDNNTLNASSTEGAGIWNEGPATIVNSTISRNRTIGPFGRGGGILSNHEIEITNSTLSDNQANGESGFGGGFFSWGDVTVRHSTIASNFAFTSGGGFAASTDQILLENSIVAGNTSFILNPDIGPGDSTLVARYTLVGSNEGTLLGPAPVGSPDSNGNLIGTVAAPIDPKLAELVANGGPTKTRALQATSPAINAGQSDAVAGQGNVPTEDQRGEGFARIAGPRLDMGAFELAASNHDPVVTVGNGQILSEGTPLATLSLASFTDADSSDTHSASINWGDGTPVTSGGVNATLHIVGGSHTYADNGVYTVTVTVFDNRGGSGSASFLATVNNVAPALTGTSGLLVNEGQAFTLEELGVRLNDPGFDNPLNPATPSEIAETFSGLTIDWGDGSEDTPYSVVNRISGAPGTATTARFEHAAHTYADNGTYTVTVMIQDDDASAVARQFQIVVHNVAPTLSLSGLASVNEGAVYTLNLSEIDPGADTISSWTINWGDGTQTVAGNPASVTHKFVDGKKSYVISATATDEDGAYTAGNTVSVTVRNVVPVLNIVRNVSGTDGLTVSVTGTISDPGADIFRFFIDWGDGTTTTGDASVFESPGSGGTQGSFAASHTYGALGEFTITARTADDDMSGSFADGNEGIDYVERSTDVDLQEPEEPTETVVIFIPPDAPPVVEPEPVLDEPVVLATTGPSLLLALRPETPPTSVSDAGSGGGVPAEEGPELAATPIHDATRDDQVVQAAYYPPRMVDRDEVIDAAFALGDIEAVSLVGVDMGDEPVLAKPRKAPPAEPEVADAGPATFVPIANVPVPEVPSGPGWTSLGFWAALAGSGTLWLGGTWWWIRRGRKILK